MHKKWSFPLNVSSVNVIESAENCGFGYNYWRNPSWKTSFFVFFCVPIYGSSWVCSQSQSFRRQFQRFKKISLFESLITKKKKKKIEQENSMLFMVSILLVVSLIDKLIKLQWLEMKFGLLPSKTIVSFALMKYL